MALDTYANLQTAIATWLNRQDLTVSIPDFISLAESQIVRRLTKDGPVRRMMGRSDASIATEFASLPIDFMGVRAFMMTDSTPPIMLKSATPDQLLAFKQGNYSSTGQPQVFAIVGNEFQFWPAPDDTYSAELTYWKRIPMLSDVVTTNWVLQYYPDAYLYGALLQSAPYLMDDNRVSMWSSGFQTILNDMVEADKTEQNSPYQAVNMVSNGTFDGMSNGYGWNFNG